MQDAASLNQARTVSRAEQEATVAAKGNRFFQSWVILLLIGLVVGIWGAVTLLVKGHGVAGTNQQIPWGVLVPSYLFLSAASAGCAIVVSAGYVLGIQRFTRIMKRATFLSIATFAAAGILVVLDLGSPQKSIYMLLSTNFQSPMRGMSLLYGIYLLLLVVQFVVISRGNSKNLRTISILTGMAAIAASSTLGAIFGYASVRAYYSGAFSPIYFVLAALIIGTSLLLLVTILQHKFTNTTITSEDAEFLSGLGKFLGIMVFVTVLFTLWKNLAGVRSSVESTALVYQNTLSSWWYWVFVIVIGLAIPLILLLRKSRSVNSIAFASVLVLVGMFMARFEFIIGGQAAAVQPNLQHPGFSSNYAPTFVEIAVIMLAFAVGALIYTVGARKLKLEKSVH